jgi:hypothetical protein
MTDQTPVAVVDDVDAVEPETITNDLTEQDPEEIEVDEDQDPEPQPDLGDGDDTIESVDGTDTAAKVEPGDGQ